MERMQSTEPAQVLANSIDAVRGVRGILFDTIEGLEQIDDLPRRYRSKLFAATIALESALTQLETLPAEAFTNEREAEYRAALRKAREEANDRVAELERELEAIKQQAKRL